MIRKYATAFTRTGTLSFVITSCGGTFSVTVRRSTRTILSMIGMSRKRPGPFGGDFSRPSRKMTPRSYSRATRTAAESSKMMRTTTAAIAISATVMRPSYAVPAVARRPRARRPRRARRGARRGRPSVDPVHAHLRRPASIGPPSVRARQSSPWTKTVPSGSSAPAHDADCRRPAPPRRSAAGVRRTCHHLRERAADHERERHARSRARPRSRPGRRPRPGRRGGARRARS